MVAKKRGTGMREQNASATVYEKKDGEWKVIATSAAAIRDTIQQIIGFRKDRVLTSCAITSRGIPKVASGLYE